MPATKACANHGSTVATRQHCPIGEPCGMAEGISTPCHWACYCRRCDHQWVEPCIVHQVSK